MSESIRLHPALKQAFAGTMPHGRMAAEMRPLGMAGIDQVLGGGLAVGRLHEIFAAEGKNEASALGFAAMLALCVTQEEKAASAILWLREESAQRKAPLHGPGLIDLGLDPAQLFLGVLPDTRALLRAGVDALHCAALGVVILELGGNPPLLDLTASRRFALAAEASGVTPLLVRVRGAQPMPSAAHTRWQAAAAPSVALEADAPGHTAFALSLLRQRGGAAGLDWEVEWDRDAGRFRPAALPGTRLPLSGGGPLPSSGAADDVGDAGWRIAI